MDKITYPNIAKALINDSREVKTGAHFDFSSIENLSKQLENLFVIRWGKEQKNLLKNVAEYVKKL